MNWKAVARSAIGTSHQNQGIVCQDYGDYRIFKDVIVGAVADGAGSAKHSDVGSRLAVETVLKYLGRISEYLQKRKRCWQNISQEFSQTEADKLFTKTVNDRALPSIIDTDSFQVRNPKNNKVYRCLVGSEGFTPPELIDKDFSSIDQTEVHDRFRLAVIIYQLLFGGQTPFAGKWIGAGETPETNELIRQGLWLYAPNCLIQPVERTIPLEIIHPEVQRCFLKCFNDGYKNSNLRPTAGDWVKALRLAVNELTICGKVDSHYYSQTYGKCYWCDRSTKLSIDIFPGFARPKQQSAFAVSTSQPQAFAADKIIQNVAIGEQIHTLQGHSSYVNSIAFSPDGKIFASGSRDSTIKLWDVGTGREIYTRQGHSSYVNSVAFSPDGKTLASGGYDKTIKLWDVTTGEQIRTLKGHSDSDLVRSITFSPDSKILASGSDDKTIKLWDVTTGEQIRTLKGHSNWVRSVAFSPDGKTLASGSDDKTIKLWDVTTGGRIRTLKGHSNWVNSVVFSPNGKIIASGSDDKTIKLWDVTTEGQVRTRTIQAHSDLVSSVAFSPDGKIIASGSFGEIKLWDITTGVQIHTLQGHSLSVAFSPDGKILASGSGDKTIKIWQLASLPSVKCTITTTSSFVQPTQPQFSQSSFGLAVLWCYFLFLFVLFGFISLVTGFVGGFLVGVIGIGCCWRFYRWFWRFS